MHLGAESDHAAGVFQRALKAERIGGRVDDAGLGRQKGADAGDLRLQHPCFGAGEEGQALDPVFASLMHQRLQAGKLRLAGRHNQLADLAAVHFSGLAPVIEAKPPLDAELRLQRG